MDGNGRPSCEFGDETREAVETHERTRVRYRFPFLASLNRPCKRITPGGEEA
jgi:hypothetical protein